MTIKELILDSGGFMQCWKSINYLSMYVLYEMKIILICLRYQTRKSFYRTKTNTIALHLSWHGQYFENQHQICQCFETVIILACVWHYYYLVIMIDQNQHDGKIGFNTGGDRQFWIINILSISRTIYLIMKDRICSPEGWRPPRKILSC